MPTCLSRLSTIGAVAFISVLALPATPLPKALSAEDAKAWEEGRGMGLAKPAELNGYPGPMHVLDLGEKLGLSAEQLRRTKQIYDAMHGEAVKLGTEILEAERRLDALFASGRATLETLESEAAAIALLQGRYRAVHLRAHLALRPVLTDAQVGLYRKLRGYPSK